MLKYGAVIFDLDGTLLDTLGDLAGSMNQVLRQMGFPEHPPEAYKYFVGDGMVNLARRALPPAERRDAVVTRAAAALRAAYRQRWRQKTRPYPGIPELLQALQQRQLKLSVLTNKPDDLAQVMVRTFFPPIHFAAVAGAHPSRPLKPDPAPALALARKLTLPPDRIIFLGDSGVDMQTARSAGLYAVGALWGFRPAGELMDAGAQFLAQTPAELLRLING